VRSRLALTRRSWLRGCATVTVVGAAGCARSGSDGETPNGGANATNSTERFGPTSSASSPEVATAPEVTVPTRLSSAPANAPTSSTFGGGKTIYLLPLGVALGGAELEYVEAALRLFFPFPVRRLPATVLPRQAYYVPRQRYRAERLLTYLEQHTPDDAQVMVGLTEVDISTTKGDVFDWGILGLATVSGQHCVISRFRAKRGAHSDEHVKQRLAKTVVHEVGHTIGLPHCPNYGCIMEDGKGSVLTTDHERDVCAECRVKVGASMLPVPTELPW
jgi:archaemetzincin